MLLQNEKRAIQWGKKLALRHIDDGIWSVGILISQVLGCGSLVEICGCKVSGKLMVLAIGVLYLQLPWGHGSFICSNSQRRMNYSCSSKQMYFCVCVLFL